MHRNSNILRIFLAVAVLLTLSASIASAAAGTPNISYQGKLTDAAGNPLTGTYTVIFKLYEFSSGGTSLATDTRSVTASKGLFTTQIAADPKLFDGQALWLGIKVGSDPEMTPRQEIKPVPYAISLRPGAWITSSDGLPSLNLQDGELNVSTTEKYGNGVSTYNSGDFSRGVYAHTVGSSSDAVAAYTVGENSHGLSAYTVGENSAGVYSVSHGARSSGIRGDTSGINSPGVFTYTSGIGSQGVYARTDGANSDGIYVQTNGDVSQGISSETFGDGSYGAYARTYGIGSDGLHAWSSKAYGVYAETNRADHMYGVYTPDYLYAKGTQVPAADVAEYMPVTQDVLPGTVLIIGEDGKLQPSITAYDSRVAGIVSTEPGVTLGTREDGNPGEQIIAVAGRVPCKVDATTAPIHAGDLLSTSSTPGYAMKATNPQIGTILGKAMGTLETGTGTIEVLVTLQ